MFVYRIETAQKLDAQQAQDKKQVKNKILFIIIIIITLMMLIKRAAVSMHAYAYLSYEVEFP